MVIDVTASTSTAEGSRQRENKATVYVSFMLGNEWSDNMTFYYGEVDDGAEVTATYGLPDMPTQIRFYADPGMDPWGYWQLMFSYTSPIDGKYCEVVFLKVRRGSLHPHLPVHDTC